MRTRRSLSNESGVALITAMLVVMLMSALMVGMFAALTTDTRSHAADRDQTQAYAAAQAGLEKLTSALAQLFNADASPSVAQINAIAATPPVIQNFAFKAPGGANGSGYAVTWTADAQGNPTALATSITTGPYTGFQGLITKYTATITAASAAGAEVRLRREIQTVAVPVFQFGVFSESDLTFYAGDAFNFGGRVHTNANLFACEFGPSLTFADRITAVGEAVHNTLSNTLAASAVGCVGPTNIATSPSTSRNWLMTEGSVTGMPGSAANPNWGTISNGTYRNYIRTGATGAKRLDLPLVSQGAQPIDLIRRPAINSGENLANPQVFGQRFYSQASLRILLSDRVNDIMSLPGVSATAPVSLDWDAGVPAGYVVDATHPPLARSVGSAGFQTNNNSTIAGGIAQIYYNVGAISVVTPAAPVPIWKIPLTVTVTKGAVNTVVTCNGKTGVNAIAAGGVYPAYRANSLISCNNAVAINTPATVTATVNGVTFTKTVTRNIAANGDIEMAAPGGISDTAQFSQNLLWINSSPGATVPGTAIPVTCQGYIDTLASPHFFNCIGNGMTTAPDSVWVYSSARVNQNTNSIGGFIKVERQNNAGVWTDITMEILNLGIGGRNVSGVQCADPTPNAILRIQRLADNGGGSCSIGETRNPWEWWPNTLYDTREGSFRDTATNATMNLGGVMQYIALDVNNLRLWLSGALAGTGNQAVNNNGYIVYFSDRRGNHDQNNADVETGEYGFEDQVNPTVGGCCSPAAPPDGVLQPGEDMNFRAGVAPTQEIYGRTPHPLVVPPVAAAPLTPYDGNGRPWSQISISNQPTVAGILFPGEGMARMSKVVLFRRALKLINGGINGGVNSLPVSGLTVASENPVYVQGNYNATTVATAEPNVPAAIMADAITLLSNNWNDGLSFEAPTLATARNATTTGYRFAAVAGKGVSFPYCGGNCANPAGAPTAQPGFLYGTDGGVGNFLRLLEDWNIAGVSINYRGSLISLFTSRQAIGTFKFNTNVYDFGTRVFTFDDDFLTPALLPPGTPMFRDVNTLKFRQILRPNQ